MWEGTEDLNNDLGEVDVVWNCWPGEMCGGGSVTDEGESRDCHCLVTDLRILMEDEREKGGNDIMLDEKSEKFRSVAGCVPALPGKLINSL